MDLLWLVIPAALGLFALRTYWLARRLKLAAQMPTNADLRALREAKASLQAHQDQIQEARAAPREHLAAAKRLSRLPAARSRPPSSGVDAMVEEFLPEQRL